jgi:nucleoside-diphosphate-sugar epimerase
VKQGADLPLVVVGCGFLGSEAARQALAAGRRVVATTRNEDHARALRGLGIDAHAWPVLTRDALTAVLPEGAEVIVAFAPDGRTDAEIAPALGRASAIAYISTTGVYGAARGHVDELTPTDPSDARARLRLEAEQTYLPLGATVLRAAGIYGPGRGLHRRILAGEFRIPGAGTNVVSRIHVEDLAALTLAALAQLSPRPRGEGRIFVAADDAPVPQIEVIEWLCRELHLPLPSHAPVADVAPTLRHDRAVKNRRIKEALGIELRYPSYREGFLRCLEVER